MLRQLWNLIITSIGGLKGSERKLLFTVMFLVIVVLWLAFRDSGNERTARMQSLEQDYRELLKSKETQRILMQDKIDQCAESKYKDLKELLEQAEKLKNSIKSIK